MRRALTLLRPADDASTAAPADPLSAVLRDLAERSTSPRIAGWAMALLAGETAAGQAASTRGGDHER